MLVRNLSKRVAFLEDQVGSRDPENTIEWRESVVKSLALLLEDHDWTGMDSGDTKRALAAEMQYANIMQLVYMLPVDTVLDLWRQYAPIKEPAVLSDKTHLHTLTDKKLMKTIKGDVK